MQNHVGGDRFLIFLLRRASCFQVANLGEIVGLRNPSRPILKTSTRPWLTLESIAVQTIQLTSLLWKCWQLCWLRTVENLLGRMILPGGIKVYLGVGVWNMSMQCPDLILLPSARPKMIKAHGIG